MDGNSASNRLAQLPPELLASMTRYLMASSICRLFTGGNSKLNYLLKNGGVLAFRHELDLRRQYWPTVVKEFPLIHEFSLGIVELPVDGTKPSQGTRITPEQLLTLPRTLRRLYLHNYDWLPPNTQIFSLFPHLEEYICANWNSTAATLQQIPPTLHRLTISDLTSFAALKMEDAQRTSSLETLELTLYEITEEELAKNVTKFPENLTSLSVALHSRLEHTRCSWLDSMHFPKHLTKLYLLSDFGYLTKRELLAEIPPTLTYLRLPLVDSISEWEWLPPKLTHLRLTNWEGKWHLTDLSPFPRSLTYLRLRHSFDGAPPDAPLCAPPNLRVYKGIETLSAERCLQLPKTLTSLTVCTISPPSSSERFLELSKGDPDFNYLPPSVTILYLQELNLSLPPAFVASLRKVLLVLPDEKSVSLLNLQNWKSLEHAWIEFPEVPLDMSNFSFPTHSLTFLKIEQPPAKFDWTPLLPTTLLALDVQTDNTSMYRWWKTLPRSLTALNIYLQETQEFRSNDWVFFHPEELDQIVLPELRYLMMAVFHDTLNFAALSYLPPRLGHLSLDIGNVYNFSYVKLLELCPLIAEVHVSGGFGAERPGEEEVIELGVRVE